VNRRLCAAYFVMHRLGDGPAPSLSDVSLDRALEAIAIAERGPRVRDEAGVLHLEVTLARFQAPEVLAWWLGAGL